MPVSSSQDDLGDDPVEFKIIAVVASTYCTTRMKINSN